MAKHIYLYKTVFPFEFPFILFIDKCRDIRILLVQNFVCVCASGTQRIPHTSVLFHFLSKINGTVASWWLKMSIIHNILDE